jgi:xanthine dehydrogenase accessory factor
LSDQPEDEVHYAPAGACFLVMTHSHDLDFAIGRAILDRGDFHWAGLIGSDSKAASFAGRWERQGCSREEISRITCPIGLPGIASKHPGAIAVSVAAQLQQVMEQRESVAWAGRNQARKPAVQSRLVKSPASQPVPMAAAALSASVGPETAMRLATGAA